jgi:hypothetical protein
MTELSPEAEQRLADISCVVRARGGRASASAHSLSGAAPWSNRRNSISGFVSLRLIARMLRARPSENVAIQQI